MSPTLSFAAVAAVALGGAVGSVARYATNVVLASLTTAFPWATLLVNVVGAFLIGVFTRNGAGAGDDLVLRLALTTGLCGGFTTFSAFSIETVALVQQGRAGRAMLYVFVSLALGLGATFLGLTIGRPRG